MTAARAREANPAKEPKSHALTRTLLVLIIAALAASAAALGVAIAQEEPYVYDEALGVTLPQSDYTLNQQEQPDLTITTDGSDIHALAPDEPPPAAISPSIDNVSNESDSLPSSPFSPGEIKVTNRYVEGTSEVVTAVFAGALADNQQQGVFVVLKDFWSTGDQASTTRFGPAGEGAITLTSFSGHNIEFKTATGKGGTFNLNSLAVSMDTDCGPDRDPLAPPCI